MDAGQQFLGLEGLGHVVVGAHLKTGDLVQRLAFGRQHDDGRLGRGTDLAEHAPSVHNRQHDVKKDKIGTDLFEGGDALAAVRGDRGLKPIPFHVQTDELGDIGIILDDQDLFCHRGPSFHTVIFTDTIIQQKRKGG